MSTLAEFTTPRLILPNLRSRDAAGVAAELCSTLHREGFVPELLPFYNAIISRETLCSTAASPGWALPHARMSGLPRLAYAVGRTAEPMRWFGHGRELVRVVFLFAVPEDKVANYLNLVSALARLSQSVARVEALLRLQEPEEFLELLEHTRLREPRPAAARA